MAATITIEIDDAGRSTVSIDGKETYQCDSVKECLAYLQDTLEDNAEGEDQANDTDEAEEMWQEEAASRPRNPNLMY